VAGLPALLQFIASLQTSGTLRVAQGRWSGTIAFEEGRVSAASFGRERGLEALEAMLLAFQQGQFVFTAGAPSLPEDCGLDLSAEQLPAHLAAAVARQAALAAHVPPLEAIPRVSAALTASSERRAEHGVAEGVPEQLALRRRTLQTLLAAMSGRRTVGELASRYGTVQTLEDLVALQAAGLISLTPPEIAVPAASTPLDVTVPAAATQPRPSLDAAAMEMGPCPKLGFADDPTNHYSRPTQLHRCYALEPPERIALDDQRRLCLTDRFRACPRYVAAAGGAPLARPVLAAQPGLVGMSTEALPSSSGGPGTEPASGSRRALELLPVFPALETSPPEPAAGAPPAPVLRRESPASLRRPTGSGRRLALLALRGAPLLALVILLVVLVLATGIAGRLADPQRTTPSAPLAGSTAARLQTPVTTATGTPAGSGVGLGLRTILDERFTDNQRGWPSNPQSVAWFADGAYRILARQPGRFVAIGAPGAGSLGDVVVSGTFRKLGGPPGGGYGLIVRDQGPGPRDGINQGGRYYVLEAGDRGEFGIWRREADHWVDLIPWTPTDAIRPGSAPNELAVAALGPSLSFTINGQQVASVTDPVLAQGSVGLFVGGDGNDVRVERFIVAQPR